MRPWMKAAVQGGACGLMFGMVVLIGGRVWQPQAAAAQAKQATVPDVVKARRFEVVDEAGKARAALELVSGGGPHLRLHDAAGKMRVFLSARPSLYLSDGAEEPRIIVGLTQAGNPSLTLSDKAGTPRAVPGSTSLETVKTGETTIRPESSLVLFAKDGKVIWQAP